MISMQQMWLAWDNCVSVWVRVTLHTMAITHSLSNGHTAIAAMCIVQ